MQNKKTLLVTLDYPPSTGGVANYYYNLLKNLPHDEYLVLDNQQDGLLFRSKLVWPRWLKGFFTLRAAIAHRSIGHILVGQVLPIGTIAWLLSYITPISYTVMTHAMDITILTSPDASKRKRWLLDRILRKAHSITTVSSYTAQQLLAIGAPEQKIHFVRPCPHISGLDLSPDQQKGMSEQINERYHLAGKKVLLTVARLQERKGIDTVLSAITQLQHAHPELVYAVVGDGPYREELERIVRVRKLQKQVVFAGKVDDAELTAWFARADIFVMTPRQLDNGDVEGFGIVYVEAATFGVPAIGSKSGGVPDAIIDSETGILVDPDSVEMLTKAIQLLVTNPLLADTLGKNARKRVQQDFNWSGQAHVLHSVVQSALADTQS